MDRSQVLLLGHGEMGHAMEALLGARHAVTIWQRRAAQPLATLARESDFIIFCLPAMAHAEVAAQLAAHLSPRVLCLTIAKGLDDRGRLPAEILVDALGRERVAVIYGPMIAEELRAGRPGFAECAAPTPADSAHIAALFGDSALHIEPASDLTGLSWSAILKNVYAIAFGMADELGLGDNVRGYLAVAALDELARLVHTLGGTDRTPYRLAGLGDLITTATSAGSHHHELGRKIVRGERDLGGEGVHTMQVLRAHPRFDTQPFPLFRLVEDCVREAHDVRQMFADLLHAVP
jgi:glycerol-3-phosphate dehydrogenase (NAD(P)+)